jgi:hypothetical protein
MPVDLHIRLCMQVKEVREGIRRENREGEEIKESTE